MWHQSSERKWARRSWRSAVGYVALAGLLALAFYGYTRPDLVVSWETLMALCGFG